MLNISFLHNLTINNSWKDFIYDESNQDKLKDIENKIGKLYYPETKNVLRFLENDLKKLKYIVVGMDPYPSHYIENGKIIPIATGRSFEVRNIKSWKDKYKQKSLAMIIKTLYYDKFKIDPCIGFLRDKIIEIGIEKSNEIINKLNNNGYKTNIKEIIMKCLGYSKDDLAKINKEQKIILFNPKSFYDITEYQGMLWLNSTLTVKPNESGSHINIWNDYIDSLFKYIVSKNSSIKYLVFGEKAKNRISNIVDTKNMITTCHPATRVNNDFIKRDCFKELKDIILYL